MPGWAGASLSSADVALLRQLQRRGLRYFLENQAENGLIQDRQRNHGPTHSTGPLSISASGMGLIAIALASASPHRLISRREAILRVKLALVTGLGRVPTNHGIMPHFVERETLAPVGEDAFSTVDSSWFFAGALWSAAFLGDLELVDLAGQIDNRVDWRYWSSADHGGQIRHGKRASGRFLPCYWDRANGETVMMYVLGAGAEGSRSIPAGAWGSLDPFYGEVAGYRFNNADLGLFVFQYGIDLLDLRRWKSFEGPDLMAEAGIATHANHAACRSRSVDFRTYESHWGLSAGDGPGRGSGRDRYNDYSPSKDIDGTAHLTATVASVGHHPEAVLANVRAALDLSPRSPLGRYGLSGINRDRGWVGRDMVGIDAGALVLALENLLVEDRVRAGFHELGCVRRGLARLGFRDTSSVRRAS